MKRKQLHKKTFYLNEVAPIIYAKYGRGYFVYTETDESPLSFQKGTQYLTNPSDIYYVERMDLTKKYYVIFVVDSKYCWGELVDFDGKVQLSVCVLTHFENSKFCDVIVEDGSNKVKLIFNDLE